MMETKRTVSGILALCLAFSALVGCKDSSQQSVTVETDYDPVAEVAKYQEYLGELSEEDKNYQIEMGYNNCDHMVACLVGQESGIYEALGLKVNLTKTGKIAEAMASGQMDCGYQGLTGAIRAFNNGAPLFMAAANHLGGSRYLVVSNDIKDPKTDLLGKKLAIGSGALKTAEWPRWSKELGVPKELENYEVVDMGQADAVFALKAGQLDGFTCWDPYAAQAESEGFGHIIATGWGADIAPDMSTGWGMCCAYVMQTDFRDAHPELAKRLVLAHALSNKYIYTHPYNAAMMFADGFGTTAVVGLRTIYMKTCKEGRTLTWHFTQDNLDNMISEYHKYGVAEEDIPNVNDYAAFMSNDLISAAGIEDFDQFIEQNVNSQFPLGMAYDDWLKKAMEIDHVTDDQVAKDAERMAQRHEEELAKQKAAREKAASEAAASEKAEAEKNAASSSEAAAPESSSDAGGGDTASHLQQ